MPLKNQIRAAIILGLLSILAGLLVQLALLDIYHGETDLTLEWNIVRLGAAVFLIFVGYSLITFRKILKII
jgi:hypothetical protein